MSRMIPLTRGKTVVVSDEDYAAVSVYKWRFGMTGGYAHRSIKIGDKWTSITLHRFLMGEPPAPLLEVDHINRDKLDCQRENMRWATRSQNQQNKGPTRNNKTGHVGVYRTQGGYGACFRRGTKTIYVGQFETPELATAERDRAIVDYERLGPEDYQKLRGIDRSGCFKGHPYNDVNTKTQLSGKRRCRVCGRERMRGYRLAKHQDGPTPARLSVAR